MPWRNEDGVPAKLFSVTDAGAVHVLPELKPGASLRIWNRGDNAAYIRFGKDTTVICTASGENRGMVFPPSLLETLSLNLDMKTMYAICETALVTSLEVSIGYGT